MKQAESNQKREYKPFDERSDSLKNEQAVIEGVVEDIIFRNEENGYTVCMLDDQTTIVGILPFINPGEAARFHGTWKEHEDYGLQFQSRQYELMAPKNKLALLHYLKSGLIKGIGDKTAERLVRTFGEKTLDVIKNQPDKVAALRGIGRQKAQRFSEQIKEKEVYQELMLLLGPHGVGTGTILKIYRQYGGKSLDVLSKNPYILADDVQGIGFLTADRLAQELGLDQKSHARIAGAIQYTMNQAVQQGHTALPKDSCLYQASQLLGFDLDNPESVLQILYSEDKLLHIQANRLPKQEGLQQDMLMLPSLFAAESQAAKSILKHMQSQVRFFKSFGDEASSRAAVRKICRLEDMQLAAEQESGLITALTQSVSILTGGPGTGKTTIIRVLCKAIKAQGGRVTLAAPTGRAARRMSESSGFQASTLHRLLQIGYEKKDHYDEMDQPGVKLNCDLLIVDEASMIDIYLFRSLCASLTPGMRLLLVGDADQLPSVGPGYVLKDLMNSRLIPVTELTQIYRQAKESLIIKNAHRIHHGEYPEIDQSFDSQFILVLKDKIDEMAAAVQKLCVQILPEQYSLDPLQDVQVLTPLRKGTAGCTMLNQMLQSQLNPADDKKQEQSLLLKGNRFSCCDKVMQIRNNYDLSWHMKNDSSVKGKGVFNGETGTIIRVDKDNRALEVLFDDDRLVLYDVSNLDDLELAYAITIHKSQGSEYPVVVLVLPPGAPHFLTRNLLYTAVTRAKKKIILVSSRKIINMTVENNAAYARHTLLSVWLTQT